MKIRNDWRMSGAIVLLVFFTSACHTAGSGKTTVNDRPSVEDGGRKGRQAPKELVLQLYQALNDTNWALARTFVSEDFQHHYIKDTGFAPVPWSDFEKGYRMSKKAFPDWKLTPVRVVAEGDYVSVLLRGEGTHTGDFAGIPATHVKATAPIMLLHQVANGKIVADWEVSNTGLFVKQLKK
ncbi:MAG: hypothetical protein EOO16_24685 [Chitinophagaceae bacterium]|nr:MAG: hypothetical protein EOO16_24685 [Chitinophagaceae bacterium]